MTWTYKVETLAFKLNDVFQFSAEYAGAGESKNKVADECLINQGPLPRGRYKISGPIHRHRKAGPYVLRLTPHPDNNMCGRSGFLIHGNNSDDTASTGCIILHIRHRREIIASGDFDLVVK